MSNLTPIKGSGSEKRGKKEEPCPHCGLVPQSEHPAFSCPRLSGVSWDGENGYDYAYEKYDQALIYIRMREDYLKLRGERDADSGS